MVFPKKRNPGKPPQYVTDDQGKTIEGMSAVEEYRADGSLKGYRFYITSSRPKRIWLGRDKQVAIQKFRAWQATQAHELVTIDKPLDSHHDSTAALEKYVNEKAPTGAFQIVINPDGSSLARTEIQAGEFWDQVRQELLADPKKVAKRTGIDWLEHGATLPKPQKLTLNMLSKLECLESKNDTWKRYKKWWAEFVGAVGNLEVKAITNAKLQPYAKWLAAQQYAPKTFNDRLGAIRAVLDKAWAAYAPNRTDLETLKREFDIACQTQTVPEGNPTPIEVEDYHAIYGACDTLRDKAMILCMLNFGIHPGELTQTKFENYDFNKGTFFFIRNKRGKKMYRSILWAETIAAIKAYQQWQAKQFPGYEDQQHMFLTIDDKPFGAGGYSRWFGDVLVPKLTKAGIKIACTLDSIRDGSQNAADEAGCDPYHTKMWLGHSLGKVAGAYKKPTHEKTRASSTAAYAHYRISDLVK